MESKQVKTLHSEESLKNIGYNPEDAQGLHSRLSTREQYREEVAPRLEAVKSLITVSDLFAVIKLHTMPEDHIQSGVSESEKQRIAVLIEKSGIVDYENKETGVIHKDKEKALELLFGKAGTQDKGLIQVLQDQWNLPGLSVLDKRYQVGSKIVETFGQLYAGRRDLAPIFSPEPSIPIMTTQGEVKVSPRDILVFNLDTLPNRIARLSKVTAEAMLAVDPDLSTYTAYEWTKDTAYKSAFEGLDIFPTPDTESVKEQIRIAHAKRNGLLKYILIGEAGVGKTRLIQATDVEQGKDTVVINFHEFITFEELIGQTAMTVNLEGTNKDSNDTFVKIVERFGGMDDKSFWEIMKNVYGHLPENLKKRFTSAEHMVESYGNGVAGIIEEIDGGLINAALDSNSQNESTAKEAREKIRERFQKRIKAIMDISILGFSKPSEENIQAKWIQGAILNAMQEGKVVCFDEMDKAGPYAIEGLLSFLSLSPGKVWNYQGGSIKIPNDFYITATSNRSNIGAFAKSEDMNRYLADRTEQIEVKPQSVKGSLMIAAVNLSDTKGNLLINKEEQIELITAFSYILPKLQKANLTVPMTNRVIKTICSRLVDYQENSGGRSYFRAIDGATGRPQSVAEALRLSVLGMKGMSLGKDGQEKVQKILSEYGELLGEKRISQFGQEFKYFDMKKSTDKREQRQNILESRRDAFEYVWQQPLFQAIGALDVGVNALGGVSPEEMDISILGIKDVDKLIAQNGGLKRKTVGRKNGIVLNPTESGIYMQTHLPDSIMVLDSKKIGDENNAGSSIEKADQLGGVFVVKSLWGESKLHVGGHSYMMSASYKEPVIVDPLGGYVFYVRDNNLVMGAINNEEFFNSHDSLVFDRKKTEVIDMAPNGSAIIIAEEKQLKIIAVNRNVEGDAKFTIIPLNKAIDQAKADFVGNNLLILTSRNGRRAVIL